MATNTTDSLSKQSSRRRHVAADGSVREYDSSTHSWHLVVEPRSHTSTVDALGNLLALEGRQFEYDFANGEFVINGHPLFLVPSTARGTEKQQDGDTGRTVWDGAVLLAKYLEKN